MCLGLKVASLIQHYNCLVDLCFDALCFSINIRMLWGILQEVNTLEEDKLV